MTEQEMREDKNYFINNCVLPCLMNIDRTITNIRYAFTEIKNENLTVETVTIFRSKKTMTINITGENKLALLEKILKLGLNRTEETK